MLNAFVQHSGYLTFRCFMAAGFSNSARQPEFIVLAVIAALGWIVAIWTVSSSSRQEAQYNERIQQLETTHQTTVRQFEELKRSAGTTESLQEQLTTARADLATLKQQQEEALQAQARVRSQTEEADKKLHEMREAQVKTQGDLAAASENLVALERQRSEAARTLGEVTASRDRITAELQQAEERSTALQQQLARLSNQVASRRSELAEIEGQLSATLERNDTSLGRGLAPEVQGASGPTQQIYRCDDDGSGWICSARE
jgi:chromosome segregation ATPase